MRNLTISNRIQLAFAAAISMVLLIGFLSFYYLNKLNEDLNQLITKDIGLARLAEEIKTTRFELHRVERSFFTTPQDLTLYAEIEQQAIHLRDLIHQARDSAVKEENIGRYTKMGELAGNYLTTVAQIHTTGVLPDGLTISREMLLEIGTLNNAVLQDRYKELEAHQKEVDRLGSNAQRNMIIVILIMLVSSLALGFLAPSLVGGPFKRMRRAIGEVRGGKLNVSIPAETEDELGTLAKELNAMLADLRIYDDMKIKRIAFEKRRFETLSNMVDYGVMLLTREGDIEFMNTQLYILLGLQSEDCVGCAVDESPLPAPLKTLLDDCLEKQEKFDNQEISLDIKDEAGNPLSIDLHVDLALVRRHDGTVANLVITFEEPSPQSAKRYLTRKMVGQRSPI